MKIVLAGSSGFLGTHLRRHLATTGHALVQLVRRDPTGPAQIQWWPEHRRLDPEALAGADVVINLAGVGVADRRWNAAYQDLIRSSRVDATATLATALAALPPDRRPSALLNSSAVGFYGDAGDIAVDETSPPGEGYFPEVCQAWEEATQPADDCGIRVVKLRTGLPLDQSEGLLKPLLLPFRLGVGGKLGSGRQWMPWISLPDWLAAMMFLLDRTDLAGPVNLVSPTPVRNSEFTQALASALHRPALIPVPEFALKALLGDFGREALASQRVLPGVLNHAGFPFTHPTLPPALHSALHPHPHP